LRTNSEAGLRYGRPINAREPLASTGDLRLSPLSLAIVSLGQPKTRLNPIFQLVDLFAPGAFATASSGPSESTDLVIADAMSDCRLADSP
jgi:hypothetical protein